MISESPEQRAKSAAQAGLRSLILPFNRAGAPSILDLGFDAGEATNTLDETGGVAHDFQEALPGERISHISFGFEGERWRIRNTVWTLAQSSLGQRLLEAAYRAGYRIAFDSMAFSADRLGAGCNPVDRAICLDSRADNGQLVLLLAEQLALAVNVANGVPFDFQLNPAAAILSERLLRAEAVAATLQIALELAGTPSLPKTQDNLQFLRLAEARFPRMAQAFTAAAVSPVAIESGQAMAAAIRVFYRHPAKRRAAEISAINRYRALSQSAFKDPKMMLSSFDAVNTPYKFLLPAAVYAVTKEPLLRLADPANCSVFPETLDALNHLQNIRRNAGLRDKESWALPLVQPGMLDEEN